MGKHQSVRAQTIRSAHLERMAALPTCPRHGARLHVNANYGERYVYLCGCLSNKRRA